MNPHVSDFALALGAIERLDHTTPCEVTVRIGVVDALMDLPEIEVVGSQPFQRLVQLSHRHARVPAVRADLGHEEDALAPIGDRPTHANFTFPLVVFPGVVHKGDARVDGRVNDLHCLTGRRDETEVVAAQSER